MKGRADGGKDRWTDGQMEGRTDDRMDRETDGGKDR